jgi:hypothetical protein
VIKQLPESSSTDVEIYKGTVSFFESVLEYLHTMPQNNIQGLEQLLTLKLFQSPLGLEDLSVVIDRDQSGLGSFELQLRLHLLHYQDRVLRNLFQFDLTEAKFYLHQFSTSIRKLPVGDYKYVSNEI